MMAVVAGRDPRIQLTAGIGKGAFAEIGGVVPRGINTPPGILNDQNNNASLAAFRAQLALPGAIADKLGGKTLRVAIESELVPGAVVDQTPEGFPRAHLRMTTIKPDGTSVASKRQAKGFSLTRDVPAGMETILRHQRGFNKFTSPWVIALADPRAALAYDWTQWGAATSKSSLGCNHCDRPARRKTLAETKAVFAL